MTNDELYLVHVGVVRWFEPSFVPWLLLTRNDAELLDHRITLGYGYWVEWITWEEYVLNRDNIY